MNGISIKAIALATLAVFGIDVISGLLLVSWFDLPPMSAPEAEVRAAIEAMNTNIRYLFSALALGTASTVVGGYLTARIAGRVPYFNALAFGLLGLLLGVLMTTDLPVWFRILGLSLTIPAALLGAWLFKRQSS